MPSTYSAREEYLDPDVVDDYERLRFSGRRGAYVWKREQRGVRAMLAAAGDSATILDVPSGAGRWQPALLALHPDLIVEADYSPTMLAASGRRSAGKWPLVRVEAEWLPFPDGSFDLVFSHALTKHLPPDAQAAVLRELARVSRRHVVCSFSIREGLPGLIRRVRHAQGAVAITRPWLVDVARTAGLRLVASKPCTTPVGVEQSVLFATTS